MARVVNVHGIGQEFLGPELMGRDVRPALRDGVRLAGGPRLEPEDVACAFYGNLYFEEGTRSLDIPPWDETDVDEGLEAELLEAWWEQAARVDPEVLGPDAVGSRGPVGFSCLRLLLSERVRAAIEALSGSSFFAKVSDRLIVFALKQVRRVPGVGRQPRQPPQRSLHTHVRHWPLRLLATNFCAGRGGVESQSGTLVPALLLEDPSGQKYLQVSCHVGEYGGPRKGARSCAFSRALALGSPRRKSNMARRVHVPADAVKNLIRQAYEAGGPYQWAREAWRNSEESGASIIHFGIEEQAARNKGVLRRTIMDNGSGMVPDDLLVFLSSFGGGGKPIGVDGNFGQGFKSSVLPWNPYGVVVISYTEQTPDGAMVWIQREGDSYTFKEWDVQDEDGMYLGRDDVMLPYEDDEHGCHWGEIRPDWMTTGTIMVLLGASAESDTWQGDPEPARHETVDGLVRYLNGRVIEVPERQGKPLETTVVDLYRKGETDRRDTKDKTVELPNGTLMVWRPRRVYGLRHYIPDTLLTGTVQVDDHGTVVEWFYVPEPDAPVKGTNDYVAQRPVVVVDYQGEAYHADHTKHRYRQFGITDEIKGRTWVILRPPVFSDSRPTQWGVLTQASRHILITKGGGELPWEEWGDRFFADFPEPLKKVLDDIRSQSGARADASMGKNISRILDRLNARFKASRLTTSAAGRILGIPAGTAIASRREGTSSTGSGGSGSAGRGSSATRQLLQPARGGTLTGAPSATRGGYPAFDWASFDMEEAKYLARYVQNETREIDGQEHRGVVYLNTDHPVFQQEFSYWANEVWPKPDSAQVRGLVQRVYGEEAVAHVVHAQNLNGTLVARTASGEPVAIGKEDVSQLLSPQALSAALLGLVNVEQRILTQGGGLFGGKANGR